MQEIKHIRGDTLILEGVVQDNIGTPINITGGNIIASLRDGMDKTKYEEILGRTATITNATSGEYIIEFTALETAELELIEYYLDIQFTDSLGKITTLQQLKITITYDNA